MKAITLHASWAHAVAWAGKWIENRTWAPPEALIGQRIAIHAGGRVGELARMVELARLGGREVLTRESGTRVRIDGRERALARSAIVATAVLHSVHRDDSPVTGWSPWAVPGHLHWVLTEVQPLMRPIPATGRLGIWSTDLVDESGLPRVA